MIHYRFDNNEKKKQGSRTKLFATLFFVIAGLAILYFVLGPIVRNFARGPEWLQTAANQSANSVVTMAAPKSKLIAQINTLQTTIQNDDAQLAQLKLLQDDNDALRAELSYVKNTNDVIIAGILTKPSQSLYNSLIIDRGSNDGIVEGQLVTAQGSIALGTIASVTKSTATVALFSGPQFSGDLMIAGQNITVPATGKGGGNFEIHIPHDVTIASGDTLAFPENPDLAVGVVESVQFDPRDPFQTVLARTPVNVQQLRLVEVVK